MRQIGSISSDADAEAFSDYLLTQGVGNMVEESTAGGEWAVWIENDDDLDRARAELEQFHKWPANPRYRKMARTAEKLREQEQKKQVRLRKKFVDVRTSWGQPAQWNVPVTLVLMALCVIVTVASGTLFGHQPSWLLDYFGFVPSNPVSLGRWVQAHPEADRFGFFLGYWLDTMRRGQVWRLITPIFIHFGILHLVFNLFWLRDLGAMIETRRGTLQLLAFTLAAGVVGNFAEYFWSGPIHFGGMSGVVYALFGYVWIKGRFEPHLGLGVSQQTVWIMLAWLLLCMTGLLGNIANAAHVSGLILGVAIAYAPIASRRMSRKLR
jgi:GlpG protein